VQELKTKYEAKVQTLEASVLDLQSDLRSAVAENESLVTLLADMTKQKESVVRTQKAAELQHQAVLKAKNQEIGSLKTNLQDLKEQVAAQEEEMTQFRGSARSLLKETVRLTKGRVGRVFQRNKRRKS